MKRFTRSGYWITASTGHGIGQVVASEHVHSRGNKFLRPDHAPDCGVRERRWGLGAIRSPLGAFGVAVALLGGGARIANAPEAAPAAAPAFPIDLMSAFPGAGQLAVNATAPATDVGILGPKAAPGDAVLVPALAPY